MGVYLCVAIAVIYIGKSAYDFGYEIFNQEAVATKENGRDITVVLKKDDSVYQIGKILKKKGLIKDARFLWYRKNFPVIRASCRQAHISSTPV